MRQSRLNSVYFRGLRKRIISPHISKSLIPQHRTAELFPVNLLSRSAH